MKRVLTAVVLVPLVLLVVFKAPLWLFTLVVGLVMILCLHEYLRLVKGYGIEPFQWPVYIISIFMVVATFIRLDPGLSAYRPIWPPVILLLPVISTLLPLVFGIPLVFRRDLRMALATSATSIFGALYVAMPLLLLILMRWIGGQEIMLLFVLLSVWAGDIAAYCVGRTIGRHKLAPTVSPNKTWEGAIASLLASIGIAWLVFHSYSIQIGHLFGSSPGYGAGPDVEPGEITGLYAPDALNPLWIGSLGVVANLAAQFGDLFESAIKRGAQVKDSGSLLPGHGGILDRIDALLFAIPAVWYYATFHAYFFNS